MSSELAGARARLDTAAGAVDSYRLGWLADQGIGDVHALPRTVKILLENLLRRAGTRDVTDDDVCALAAWPGPAADVAFMPGRVLMQDLTGVPAVVDLAAMRSATARAGGDPAGINPLIPVDLVIDHSVQVDLFRSAGGLRPQHRVRVPAQRRALRAAALGAAGLRGVPRGAAGRRHLSPGEPGAPGPRGVDARRRGLPRHPRGHRLAHHDDQRPRRAGMGRRRHRGRGRHARPAACSCPSRWSWACASRARCPPAPPPRTSSSRSPRCCARTAWWARFVEFFGDGLSTLSIADRATLSNMCPEYGATASYFPVDAETLRYLTFTGRGDRSSISSSATRRTRACSARTATLQPVFSETLELDLAAVVPSLAGPKRPQDRVALPDVWDSFVAAFRDSLEPDPKAERDRRVRGRGRHRATGDRSPAASTRTPRSRDRRRGRARRIRRDRRHHVVHEHVEPVRHAGRGPAGQAGRGGRARRRSRG